MKNRSLIRNYAVILALSVCSIVAAFAQGAVVSYAYGLGWIGKPLYPTYTSFPSTAHTKGYPRYSERYWVLLSKQCV